MDTNNAGKAGGLGCNQGSFDGSHHQSSLVVLDFGAQYANGSGTEAFGGATFTNAQIEQAAEAFADRYYACTGSNYNVYLNLVLGTNDSPPANGSNAYSPTIYNTLGKDWTNIALAVRSYLKNDGSAAQVYVWGGNDLETWCTKNTFRCTPASDATAWVQGFSANGTVSFDNFGSADQCPTSIDNNAVCPPPLGFSSSYDYHQSDYYYYSWGAPPAQVTPEIYGINSQSLQWAEISLYGKSQSAGAILFQGPWDEHDKDTSTDTSPQAWNDFWNALNSKGLPDSFNFSCEIHDEGT